LAVIAGESIGLGPAAECVELLADVGFTWSRIAVVDKDEQSVVMAMIEDALPAI